MSAFGMEEILKVLPHRYPMLLIDRVVECDDQKRIVAIKNVTVNEPYFQGHYPGVPIMPGVLQLEAMAQTGGLLLKRLSKVPEGLPFFTGIDNARFRRVVVPGDQMRIEVELLQVRMKMARFHGQISVAGAAVCEADLLCMLSNQKV